MAKKGVEKQKTYPKGYSPLKDVEAEEVVNNAYKDGEKRKINKTTLIVIVIIILLIIVGYFLFR